MHDSFLSEGHVCYDYLGEQIASVLRSIPLCRMQDQDDTLSIVVSEN